LLYDRSPSLGKNALKSYAVELDLDTQKFDQCLDSGQYHEKINYDLKEGQEQGFPGPPSFIVNSEPVVGSRNFESFQEIIVKYIK
jgi:protein-disulfide isomerase